MALRRRSRADPRPRTDIEGRSARWSVTDLSDLGWVLPAALVGDRPPVATRLGVQDSSRTALVDGRGAVSPAPGGITLDWAVGADDRWYVAATEPGVEQVRVDHAPIVETRMRVPGGQVVHRVHVGRGPTFPGDDEWVVIDVHNDSPLPVALAWLVRPWTPDGISPVQEVRVAPQGDGSGPWAVWTDELVAVLPRRPSRWASPVAERDPLETVVAGEATSDWPDDDGPLVIASTEGPASVAVLLPVPHTARASIALPRGVTDPGLIGWPSDPPAADAVARGWSTLSGTGPRLELPDPVLADAVAAARRSVALCHRVVRRPTPDAGHAPTNDHIVATAGGWGDASLAPAPAGHRMEVLSALAWWGDEDTVERALFDWPAGQGSDGGFGDVASTVAALDALAAHAVAAGDAGPARAWLPEVGGAVEWLGRRLRGRRGRDLSTADRALVAVGLDAGALLLAALDQPAAAAALRADADRATVDAAGAGRPAVDEPSGPETPRRLGRRAVAAATAGTDASVLWALLRQASATWTWSDPERWVGDDGLVQARLLTAVARLLVADRGDGIDLTPWMPPSWWGLGWEVHGAPTRWGRVSFAVRWHGDRPALLWEVGTPLPGHDGSLRLRAPGLDPTWSSDDRTGEALLAPVAVPDGVEADVDASSTGGVAIAAPPRSVWRPQDPGPDAPEPIDRQRPEPPVDPDDPAPGAAGSFS